MLDFYVKTRIRLSLRDKRLFEITEVEITRVDCISACLLPILLLCTLEGTSQRKKLWVTQGILSFRDVLIVFIKYGSIHVLIRLASFQ